MFYEGRSFLDHILTLCTLIEQEVLVGQYLYYCFANFKKSFDTIMCEKLWACLQQLDVPPYLQQAMKAMYTMVFTKVKINGNTHGQEMSNIGVKQGWPVPPTYSTCTLMNLKHIWMR